MQYYFKTNVLVILLCFQIYFFSQTIILKPSQNNVIFQKPYGVFDVYAG